MLDKTEKLCYYMLVLKIEQGGGEIMNTRKLLGIMVEKGFSQRSLAKAMGVSKNTLNAKLNAKTSFNTEEASKICEILGIEESNLKAEIFL